MAGINALLGWLDGRRRAAGRVVGDMAANPAAVAEQWAGQIQDAGGRPRTAGEVAEKTFAPTEQDLQTAMGQGLDF